MYKLYGSLLLKIIVEAYLFTRCNRFCNLQPWRQKIQAPQIDDGHLRVGPPELISKKCIDSNELCIDVVSIIDNMEVVMVQTKRLVQITGV